MKNSHNLQDEKKFLIWDLPTRFFHWLFVLSFVFAWITSENDRFLYEHVFAGYAFAGLLLFRFLWGWIGSYYALFRSFAYDWNSVSDYLKGLLTGEAQRHIGHNPAGGWAIFGILSLSLIVIISGLMVFGGEEGHGPLASVVGFELGHYMKEVHEIAATILLLLVFVHVVGVIFESIFHRENLVRAMITGHKPVPGESVKVRLYGTLAVVMLLSLIFSAGLYFRGYIQQTDAEPFIAFTSPALPGNDTWQEECGDCHMAFHPTLLPARSWQLMLENQNDHFEEDLEYEEEKIIELLDFAVKNAAESKQTEAAFKINKTEPESSSPQRITGTVYWKEKHEEIEEKYWTSEQVGARNNCEACHLDAKTGWFEDSNMRLPKL